MSEITNNNLERVRKVEDFFAMRCKEPSMLIDDEYREMMKEFRELKGLGLMEWEERECEVTVMVADK